MSTLPVSEKNGVDWLAAIAVALLAHGGLYWWFTMKEPAATALGAGVNGMEISLGNSGGAVGGEVAQALRPQEVVAEDVQTKTVEAIESVEVQEVTASEEVVEPVVEEVETINSPEITEAITVPQPQRKPVPETKTVEAVQPRKPPEVEAEEPVQEVVGTDRPVAEVLEEIQESDTDIQGTGGQGEAGASQGSGADNVAAATSGGGVPGEVRDYQATIQALLARRKSYPRRARRRGIEGIVTLWFRMNRQGEVLDYRIQRTSGNRLLDNAIERLIEKASPLPPFPDSIARDTMELAVPFRFSID